MSAVAKRLKSAITAALEDIDAVRRHSAGAEILAEFYHLQGLIHAYSLVRFNSESLQAQFPKVAVQLLQSDAADKAEITDKIDFLFLKEFRHVA